MTCLGCDHPGAATRPSSPIDRGNGGASALRKHQRLQDAREERARQKLGGLGVFVSKVIDEPPSTRVWQQGGNGEVRVAARLETLLNGSGVQLLHDRRVPGHGHTNIDHIAVGRGGITVIDAKTHRGKIRRDSSDMTGCWDHRHDILWSFDGTGALAMGAATGFDTSGVRAYAMLLGRGDSSYVPSYTDTWAAAQTDGAGSHAYNPGTPQMTVEIEMEGASRTVSDSHGQACTSGTCMFAEPVGHPVTLTAAAHSGSSFSEWLGPCSGSGTCSLTPEQSSQGPSGSGSGSGEQTGAPRPPTLARIVRLTTSRATIRVTVRGSRLICTLSRWLGHRWHAFTSRAAAPL